MKKSKFAMVVAALAAYSATALAAAATENVVRVGSTSTGVAFVWVEDGTVDDAPSCATATNLVVVDASTEEGKLMYRTAMAAQLAGKRVRLHFNSCHGDYPLATRIDMIG